MPGLLPDSRQRKRILDELERILQSPHFRTSRRSQQFLRYVVEQTLDGHEDRLKERAIGMTLFDRPPDYDTGEDAAVRVAANEVRKRLAQHYVTAAPAEVRIELPPGATMPSFSGRRRRKSKVREAPGRMAESGVGRWRPHWHCLPPSAPFWFPGRLRCGKRRHSRSSGDRCSRPAARC